MAQKFDTIPAPDATLQGLLTSVQALKVVVEQLVGTQGNLAPARHTVSRTPPAVALENDLWTRPALLAGEITSISYYQNGKWIQAVHS